MKKLSFTLLTLMLVLGASLTSFAQEVVEPPKPRLSPLAIARTTVDATHIKVVYGQPMKKDRVIFGELEPYGKVWRTGANEATEIFFSTPVNFGGTMVPAGTYSLFTIPNSGSWTVILNSVLGQFGAFQYNEENDVLRFDVPVHESDKMYEAFTISFTEATGGTDMNLNWDRVHVVVPIKTGN